MTDTAAAPAWGAGWRELRDLWSIDPSVTFLNHGSYGATPLPVLEEQSRLRAQLERQPVDFFMRHFADLHAAALADVAAFLGADDDGCVFVANASSGTAVVLSSLQLSPGDEILTTDHAYAAVGYALDRLATVRGVRVVRAAVPLPVSGPGDVLDAVSAQLTDRTRLVVIDAVTSMTATVFPVADIIGAARAAGVPTLVDAAHAPGMLPVDLRALQPDYWVGNLHKWVCAPKGAAVLYAAPEVRAALLPLVTSYGYGEGFSAEFALSGTSDPTAWLAAPSSISLLGGIGWDRIRGYGQALVRYGQRVVCDAVGTEPIVPDSMTAMMTLVPMPPGVADDRAAAESVAERLWAQHRIEVPVWSWQGRGLLRLCGHVYNRAADYDHLAEVLPSLLRS